MFRQYSIAEARKRLARIVREAEQGTTVEFTRRGMPVAILLSLNKYKRLSRKRGSFWESYQEFRRNYGDLDVETADAFEGVRDPPGCASRSFPNDE